MSSQQAASPPYIVGLPKLTAMTLLTGGIYTLYWFYKHWRAALGDEASSWLVAFYAVFGGLSCFGLFKRLKIPYWPSLATAYLVLPAAFNLLPVPYRYLTYLLELAPIFYVQSKVNADHARITPGNTLLRTDIAMLVFGLPLLVLSIWLQQQNI